MAYDEDAWRKRHRGRADITSMLTHLTRERDKLSSVEVLLKILREQTIRGSRAGFVMGDRPVVCFQDAPLLGLAQNVHVDDDDQRPRYRGVGLGFSKLYAFERGARPVVYEKSSVAKKMLPKDEHWRIVGLNLSNPKAIVDWTHEREWRCPGDFAFDLSHCGVVVSDARTYRAFVRAAGEELLGDISGLTILRHSMV